MPELPMDLVEEEILCRVPARSLKRLRSTCKRWNFLFTNPRFVTKHSDKAAKELLVLMLTHASRICPLSVNLHGIVPSVEVKSGLSLIDPRSNHSHQFGIYEASHCDGLLLLTSSDQFMRVVWNPCTGQTRWIKPVDKHASYVLGYSKSSSSSKRCYKVLSFRGFFSKSSEIYEFSSDSWRHLDHGIISEWYSSSGDSENIVSLKGNAYWLASDFRETHRCVDLLCFDFSSEKFSLLVRLPYHCLTFEVAILSVVVGEEKLSVLLQRDPWSKFEIWVTNTIDETKPVSWSKVLTLGLSPDLEVSARGRFLLYEEKKLALWCERLLFRDRIKDKDRDKIYCVGEDGKVTEVYFRSDTTDLDGLAILNYVPSLVQIEKEKER